MVIYAESQPGYAGSPIIVLDGTGVTTSGLVLGTGSDGSAIRGFDIIDFTAAGSDGIDVDSGGNFVQANYVGLQTDGLSVGQNTEGVLVQGANNTIGGATAGTGNVISGNENDGVEISGGLAGGNVVEGNYVGTDATGTTAYDLNSNPIGNINDGVQIDQGATDNTVGGLTAGARNLISGNQNDGVEISGSGTTGNVVEGDYIGIDVTGAREYGSNLEPIQNINDGVQIDQGASGNTVGGLTAGARNIISGNKNDGVEISGSGTTGDVVEGNYIGLDATGTTDNGYYYGSDPLGNESDGVEIDTGASSDTIGGTTAAARNIISGNRNGVEISGSGTTLNLVEGNYIGLDVTGTTAYDSQFNDLGNSNDGVEIDSGASGNTIGGSTAGAQRRVGKQVRGHRDHGTRLDRKPCGRELHRHRFDRHHDVCHQREISGKRR